MGTGFIPSIAWKKVLRFNIKKILIFLQIISYRKCFGCAVQDIIFLHKLLRYRMTGSVIIPASLV